MLSQAGGADADEIIHAITIAVIDDDDDEDKVGVCNTRLKIA